MSNPDIKEVIEINSLKEQAKALYTEVDKRIEAIKNEHGAGRFDYDLEQFVDENSDNQEMELVVSGVVDDMKANGRYLKLEITDNVKKLEAGESVFSSTSFKPIVWATRGLKRCPESLK